MALNSNGCGRPVRIHAQSAQGNSTRNLWEEPRTVPSANARLLERNAPAKGGSTRKLPCLFDEPGGECERSLIHPPNIARNMYVCVCPSEGGLRRRQERQPILRTSHPATLDQRVRGPERAIVLALRRGIFQYNNVLVQTVRREVRIKKASL